MSTVLLIIQLVLSVILTALILVQRSEGGALGIGGGGGGFMSGRSATSSIVKMTSFVGLLFIVNCVALTIAFNRENAAQSVLEAPTETAPLTRTQDSGQAQVPTVDELLGTDPETTPETPAADDTPTEGDTPDAEPTGDDPQ